MNVDQKSLETVISIAICRQSGDKWQSKTLFITIFSTFVDIISDPIFLYWVRDIINAFDYRISGVFLVNLLKHTQKLGKVETFQTVGGVSRLNSDFSAIIMQCSELPNRRYRERNGSVVECLTRDRRAADSSLIGVTALWPLSKKHLS